MKTNELIAIALSALSLATSASAAPNKRQNYDPLPRAEATCCYYFDGGGEDLLIPTKGDGSFISEGRWCFLDITMDPKFPTDCEKATRSDGGGYCGAGNFAVAKC
ncbi:hypothetical protein F5X68DRAFT_237374 [Plectosphaerella plurivora]|uniref:Uncharacterized protein n=1 Tax=Plectosphaerella plurivora TaxID=936078 RepID=A0A9P8V114_9PEZI|nr:hypothetical protein F5X68DRAFT_237374 [Plectosphaerella plurivora]